MLQSFFNSLAGMTNFSRGLDNISNNIANMNTPGYRGNDVFLRSVNDQNGDGIGARLAGESARLQRGEIRQTGNFTDLAINGDGYFVLQTEEGELRYTRAGQFSFDEDDKLIDTATGLQVMALSENGELVEFDVAELRFLAPEPTTRVEFSGVLARVQDSFTTDDFTVFNAGGREFELKLEFTNAVTPGEREVIVRDSSDGELARFAIRFGPAGSLLSGFNSATAEMILDGEPQSIEFFFGEPGSFSGVRQDEVTQSSITGEAEDGRPTTGLANFEFDEEGVINFTYVNEEEASGPQLVLARFNDDLMLRQLNGAIYSASRDLDVVYGAAASEQFGLIDGGSIELSNVDLTQEFADMLIVQRGYQASSRVLSIANELIEQLYGNNR